MSESTVPVPTAEEIVAGPLPGSVDLEKEIKQAAQPFGKLTMWLGVLAVVALAFAGGAWTHSALAGGSSLHLDGFDLLSIVQAQQQLGRQPIERLQPPYFFTLD